jgi:DNA-binding response OmpR family regulator
MPAPRLLIVDDEQPLARILSFAFENEGYRVDVARDGIECMNKVSTFAPDVVLMDIMMPKLDGLESIRLLRQNQMHQRMVIIAISARTSEGIQTQATSAGADVFIKKPFQIAVVIEQVETLLASKRPR